MTHFGGRVPFFGLGLLIRAFESSPDAVQIDDIEGTILYVNDTWTWLFDRRRAEAVDRRWEEVMPRDADIEALRKSWDLCIPQGGSVGTLQFRRAGGASVSVSYSRTLYRNADGVPTAIITVYRPVRRAAG